MEKCSLFLYNKLIQLYLQVSQHCALDLEGFCGSLPEMFDYFLERNPERQSLLST